MLPKRWRKKHTRKVEIDPDEILIDSSNLPEFDTDQMEGRIERPLGRGSFVMTGAILALLFAGLVVRAVELQMIKGGAYAKQALENQLNETPVFADRGVIVDRTGRPLAWNDRTAVTDEFAKRVYADFQGLAHAVGYVKPPAKDSAGFYYRDFFLGVDGAERAYNATLAGQNGLKLTETDARGRLVSQAQVDPAVAGQKLALSVDAEVTQALYRALAGVAHESRLQGAAGVVMDVRTGELLALTSYPNYPQKALTDGDSAIIKALNKNPYRPFLDRATGGLYAPGSIVKPMVAAAALTEGIITENTKILSTGSISVPNPYDPSRPSIFKDWRVNGLTDVRDALAVSSDIFFYEVGGGYQGQAGLGIAKLDQYFKMFGFGQDPGLAGFDGALGTIPTPEWKAKNFPADKTWRIGDTYHTAIGQYRMLVSPLQAVRAAAAVANGGTLLTPTLIASSTPQGTKIQVSSYSLQVVREGMRQGVTTGIAQAINFTFVQAAAKTGTAEVGMRNEYQNAWVIGFWPYENPRYAFAVVLERLPAGTAVGGPRVMAEFFQYLNANHPEYLQ
ncbi:MAG: penicillin-binding transpeptidase domain-containing protein [Patescibacteria group bacterium]